jgi:hypothetical protein
MSAVLKPVVEEGKNLAIILAVSDELPADFYSNKKYADQLRSAIESTKGLVYPLDDAGEKMAKADATAINKYATQFKKFVNDTFKRETDEVSRWKTDLMALVNELLDNRQKTLDQFAETRQAKLAEIRTKLMDTMIATWDELGVKPEFRKGDIEPFVLFGSMTEGGKLTKKAEGAVRTIANGNLAEQNRIAQRHMLIENRCLRADINPPLSYLHLGELFFTADDEAFNAKLEELVDEEITRRAEMAERIAKQQEAETQRKIDEALKRQQAESEQYEKEKAKREAQAKWEEEQRENGSGSRLDAAKAAAKAEAESQTPASASVNGRRSVVVTAQFRFDNIRDTVSNEGVEKFLLGQLPEKLQAIATIQESHNA